MGESPCGVWKPRLYSRKRIRRGGFTEHKRYEEVKEFFGYNLISNEEVKNILEQYSENENVEAAAFLLECLEDNNEKDMLKID